MFTFYTIESQDNSGTYYGARVIPVEEFQQAYDDLCCGHGGDYPTAEAAQIAAGEWLDEMRNGPYAAR